MGFFVTETRLGGLAKKIGGYFVFVTLGGFGATQAYVVHRVGDNTDNYVELKREQSEIVRTMNASTIQILSAIHDKDKACEVLQATVSGGKYTHNYCKGAK